MSPIDQSATTCWRRFSINSKVALRFLQLSHAWMSSAVLRRTTFVNSASPLSTDSWARTDNSVCKFNPRRKAWVSFSIFPSLRLQILISVLGLLFHSERASLPTPGILQFSFACRAFFLALHDSIMVPANPSSEVACTARILYLVNHEGMKKVVQYDS